MLSVHWDIILNPEDVYYARYFSKKEMKSGLYNIMNDYEK